MKALRRVKALVRREEGQGMAEYGLIILLIGIATYLVVQTLGNHIGSTFSNISNKLNG